MSCCFVAPKFQEAFDCGEILSNPSCVVPLVGVFVKLLATSLFRLKPSLAIFTKLLHRRPLATATLVVQSVETLLGQLCQRTVDESTKDLLKLLSSPIGPSTAVAIDSIFDLQSELPRWLVLPLPTMPRVIRLPRVNSLSLFNASNLQRIPVELQSDRVPVRRGVLQDLN